MTPGHPCLPHQPPPPLPPPRPLRHPLSLLLFLLHQLYCHHYHCHCCHRPGTKEQRLWLLAGPVTLCTRCLERASAGWQVLYGHQQRSIAAITSLHAVVSGRTVPVSQVYCLLCFLSSRCGPLLWSGRKIKCLQLLLHSKTHVELQSPCVCVCVCVCVCEWERERDSVCVFVCVFSSLAKVLSMAECFNHLFAGCQCTALAFPVTALYFVS